MNDLTCRTVHVMFQVSAYLLLLGYLMAPWRLYTRTPENEDTFCSQKIPFDDRDITSSVMPHISDLGLAPREQ